MKNILVLCIILLSIQEINAQKFTQKEGYEYFLDFFTSSNLNTHNTAYAYINNNWKESFEILAIETLYFLKNTKTSTKILSLLEKETKKSYGFDFNAWYEYVWNKTPTYNSNYFKFKATLHHYIDYKFSKYFLNREHQSTIRLDEVRWGGVIQDGIPPLRNPQMITAKQATYLKDDHIVFGIAVNGDVRAYPKRILAWHEMFTDTVGGIPLAGVYCTLCGTVIAYKTNKNGIQYQFGTSGFLYRSNKLMYDKETQSLWNTLWGKPVIGPLVGENIELEYLSVVTTTWGEWKKRHPETSVLSLRTGHQRNYNEGVAYKEYFATDDLMFNIPKKDKRLKNKQQILAIRLPDQTEENLAFSSKFLKRKRIFKHKISNYNFTIFTDKSGAHRVYFTEDIEFIDYDKDVEVTDNKGNTWRLTEDALIHKTTQQKLARFPAFNAFWFGYQAAFPNVTLIK